MSVRPAIYAVIVVAMIVGMVLFPRSSLGYVAVVLGGIGLMLVIGRVFGEPWGRL